MLILKKRNIFIVEDNPQNRVIFQMSLIRHGALVDFERWGEGALRKLLSYDNVDLIVLDLMLADGISGFDIYDQIRAEPRFATTPIVAVSAMDAATGMALASQKGFAGYIAKPIDKALFAKQLAAIIEGERVWFAGERNL
jgi:CheY-like chemotaxis protein